MSEEGTEGTEAPAGAAGVVGQEPEAPAAPELPDFAAALDDDSKGWLENKGYKDFQSTVKAHRELERTIGASADQIVKLPRSDDLEGARDALLKLGWPESPDKYDLGEYESPEGQMDLGEWWKGRAHSLGIPQDAARGAFEGFTELLTEAQKAQIEQANKTAEQEMAEVKLDWGPKYNERVQLLNRAAQKFGLSQEKVELIEAGLGTKDTMNLLADIGEAIGMHKLPNDSSDSSNDGFGQTPFGAKEEFETLKRDKAFMDKVAAGDAASNAKFERLARLAYDSKAE